MDCILILRFLVITGSTKRMVSVLTRTRDTTNTYLCCLHNVLDLQLI